MAGRRLLLGLAVLAASPGRAEIPLVDLDGGVHAVTASHIVRALDRADADGAPLLVLRIDTPGGLSTAMHQIVDRILAAKTPVAVFVGPSGARAASAGFVIAIAADVVAMAPGTHMGAAHPVALMGDTSEVMSKKLAEDAAAYVRGKAERRGRNVALAEKAVTESKSYTEREALEGKLIDLVVGDVPELVRSLDGREVKRFDGSVVTLKLAGQRTAEVPMTWRESVLAAIAHPEILFLLLLGALAGLGSEISHPGLLFPGILGALCLLLFLFAAQVLPVSGAGVLLILLGVGLLAAEVKVTSYGLLTVGGIAAIILGAMMLVDVPVPELQVPLRVVVPGALIVGAWAFALVRMVVSAHRRSVVTGAEGMAGLGGVAASDLGPEGWVVVRGERWHARSEGPVAAGERVRVVSVDGLVLRVQKEA